MSVNREYARVYSMDTRAAFLAENRRGARLKTSYSFLHFSPRGYRFGKSTATSL